MRRPHTLLATLLLAAGTAAAQDYGQAATLKIWDNTTAPHSNGIATPEREPEPNRIADVSQAVLYIFPADPAKATGQAVVICPGGGYVKLCIDYEGYDMAKWFAANGITAAVLKYRMPNGHPEVPLEDVEQALRIMMGLEAGATGFTAGKVGIVGSSAGGHLAASASTLAETKLRATPPLRARAHGVRSSRRPPRTTSTVLWASGHRAHPSPTRPTIFPWIKPTRMPTGCLFCA